MKLIAAVFSTFMALLCTWTAAWLAIDETHAWKVTTTISAFLFGIIALITAISFIVDGEDW